MTAKKNTPAATRRGMSVWQRLDIDVASGGPDNCWPWTGPTNRWGYGRLSRGGHEIMVHRAAYERAKGPIPDGMVLRHTCDNPPCCNPAHLIPGTHAENHLDCVTRERHTRGTDVHCAKLTPETVLAARQRHYNGQSITELAEVYGVTRSTMGKAVTGKNWKHVPFPKTCARVLDHHPRTGEQVIDAPQVRVTTKGLADIRRRLVVRSLPAAGEAS